MTETFDQLIQARFDAVANPLDSRDWNDVLARVPQHDRSSHVRRVPTRVAFAVAAAVLVAVVTAAAFGWPQTFVDFLTSPPAPRKIKNDFGQDNVLAPKGMNPKAIPGQTRKIMTARFDDSHDPPDHPRLHTLYVAPTKSGGYCFEWTNANGGCLPAKPMATTAESRAAGPLDVTWSGSNEDYPLLADGSVRAGAAKSVEARFADGTTAEIPLTWVSAPINAGFFVLPVPRAHLTRANSLRSVVALDADGKVVGSQSFLLRKPIDEDVVQTLPDGTKAQLPRRAEAAKARKIISFRATDGSQAYLWVMPRTGGGDCYLFSQGFGCRIPAFVAHEPAFNGGLSGGAHRVLFFGQAKPNVAAVELRYQDGTSERLTPLDGFVLTELEPAHYKLGTRLALALALNANGETISTERFRPREDRGVYPCEKPINLGYGAKECP